MEKETMQGVATSINAGDKNVKLIRIVAEWWRSARYLQENKSRFEPNELEAFEYILNTPARGVVDEDKFGLSVTLIRSAPRQVTSPENRARYSRIYPSLRKRSNHSGLKRRPTSTSTMSSGMPWRRRCLTPTVITNQTAAAPPAAE